MGWRMFEGRNRKARPVYFLAAGSERRGWAGLWEGMGEGGSIVVMVMLDRHLNKGRRRAKAAVEFAVEHSRHRVVEPMGRLWGKLLGEGREIKDFVSAWGVMLLFQ